MAGLANQDGQMRAIGLDPSQYPADDPLRITMTSSSVASINNGAAFMVGVAKSWPWFPALTVATRCSSGGRLRRCPGCGWPGGELLHGDSPDVAARYAEGLDAGAYTVSSPAVVTAPADLEDSAGGLDPDVASTLHAGCHERPANRPRRS